MNSQKGSAHVIIVIGLVVVLIGALGFIFWQNFIKNDDVVVTKETVEVVDGKKQDQPEQVKPATFEISEYGIKIEIPQSLRDTQIKYDTRQIGESSYLALTTQRVIDLGGDCSKGYPFGDLVRLSRDAQSSSDEYQVYTSEKLGDYYYHVGTVESSGQVPASSCTTNPQAKTDLTALVEATKTAALVD